MSILAFTLPIITLLIALNFLINFKKKSNISRILGVLFMVWTIFSALGIVTYYTTTTQHVRYSEKLESK